MNSSNMPAAPVAAREPSERTYHGDTFVDPYAWMGDRRSPRLRRFVEEENAYTEARMAHLTPLRERLFEEFRARIQETDMSVPTRMDGYWYYARTQEGKQYGIQCRLPIAGPDDWDPPAVDADAAPGTTPGEQVVLDANVEAAGHDFFAIGGMDISKDGRWMLLGTDTHGDERYDYVIRDVRMGEELPERFEGIAAACFTPDARYVFYTLLDEAQRPYKVRRHKVGTPVEEDADVYEETDERFWVGCSISFDDRHVVISTGSKTTSEVLMLPTATPEGAFVPFIERQAGIEYDVSFATFEGAGEDGADIPVAVVYHNATNPNFTIDVIDMRASRPPYRLGDGMTVACGSPYGTEAGPGGRVGDPYMDPANPAILQGVRGLAIEGIALHRHYVALSYRADGLPRLATMTKTAAARDFLAGRPWSFAEVTPPPLDDDAVDGAPSLLGGTPGRLYSIGAGGNPSYDAPRMRYSFTSYTRPGELREIDPVTGASVLLKRATVRGDYDPRDYVEQRVWVTARDGEQVPVSLVYRRDAATESMPMFVTGYGAYEISSDPTFSVGRLSMLDRGALYAVVHVRGGGEMGRGWYEQGRRLSKKHTFEDFVDAVAALEDAGLADPAHTVANGGSAGGLLMGAIANMAPERFAGIEADVPFVDALTTILDPSLPLTVTEWDEWGDPLHDREVYEYMRDYSPYENSPEVPADAAGYPRIFITTSMNDSRVLVTEPLKWVARLQVAGVDALIRVEVEAGHGGGSGRYKQWKDLCYENAWCLERMGLGAL
ncbi:S9 family peptidase [Bifidobacterium cuniculi]|uniref:Protease II n=1 Tax=Bifidobacterium cuniculi TaxID=1688 RepID=A0A087ARP9_9BIFI|nr:S9 family peptidase [Bifidobacterium cuniculi]KFI61449.1 protease II [Bifidobacterium cuniculi]